MFFRPQRKWKTDVVDAKANSHTAHTASGEGSLARHQSNERWSSSMSELSYTVLMEHLHWRKARDDSSHQAWSRCLSISYQGQSAGAMLFAASITDDCLEISFLCIEKMLFPARQRCRCYQRWVFRYFFPIIRGRSFPGNWLSSNQARTYSHQSDYFIFVYGPTWSLDSILVKLILLLFLTASQFERMSDSSAGPVWAQKHPMG